MKAIKLSIAAILLAASANAGILNGITDTAEGGVTSISETVTSITKDLKYQAYAGMGTIKTTADTVGATEMSESTNVFGLEVSKVISEDKKWSAGVEAEYETMTGSKLYTGIAMVKYEISDDIYIGAGALYTKVTTEVGVDGKGSGFMAEAQVLLTDNVGAFAKYKTTTLKFDTLDVDAKTLTYGLYYKF